MSDIEVLLARTLGDDRRAVPASAGTLEAVTRRAGRLQLHRRLAICGTALVSVAVIAGGAMLADGGASVPGTVPSYDASESTQPTTTPPAAGATSPTPQPSPTPAPATS